MYKASEVNSDDIVKALLKSELGFYCFNLIMNAKICMIYCQKKVHTRTDLECLATILM